MARSPLLLIASLLAAAGVHAQVTKDPLPTRLVCQPNENLSANISYDSAGKLLGAGLYATSGTHECSLQSQGAGVAQPDGAVKFAWTPEDQGTRYTATVKRVGPDGYAVAFQPPGCSTAAVPASISLSAKGKGCKASVDRDEAFVLFWHQLKDAIAKHDGDMLQRLSLPQLLFAEDPDMVKAPSSIIRNAAACIPIIVTTEDGVDIGQMMKTIDIPRLSQRPLRRVGDDRASAGNAFVAKWTTQGWRLESFNTDRTMFSACKVADAPVNATGPTN